MSSSYLIKKMKFGTHSVSALPCPALLHTLTLPYFKIWSLGIQTVILGFRLRFRFQGRWSSNNFRVRGGDCRALGGILTLMRFIQV
jgi:hypothetical protein